MSRHATHDDAGCRELFEQLSGYLDGDLAPQARRELEEHLSGCPPCVEFLESLRRTVDLCHDLEPGPQPPPLSAGARQRLLAACRAALAARRAL